MKKLLIFLFIDINIILFILYTPVGNNLITNMLDKKFSEKLDQQFKVSQFKSIPGLFYYNTSNRRDMTLEIVGTYTLTTAKFLLQINFKNMRNTQEIFSY